MRSRILLLSFAVLLLACVMAGAAEKLTLSESVSLALQNNRSVMDAQEKANAADAKLGQSYSNFLPKLTISGGEGLYYSQPASIVLPAQLGGGSFLTGPDEAGNSSSYTFNLQQTLFAGGKVITAWQIADVSSRAQKEDLRRVKNETELSVTSSFYGLLKAQKGLEVINSSISNMQRNVDQAQVFYDSGIGSNLDLLRAKTQLANLEISRIQMDNGLSLARLAFENTLGVKLPAGTDIVEPETNDQNSTSYRQDELVALAYQNRPEWRAYSMAMDIAGKALNLTYSGFLPNIAYNYSYGRNKIEYPNTAASNSDLSNWKSMLVASWTLFDGFLTVNQIKEARANYNSAAAQQQNIKDGIELDVNSAYLNLKAAKEQVDASATTADLAKRTLDLTEVSYKSQIASEQNYLDAQTANQAAQLNLFSSKYDYEIAKAKLNKAVGTKII